MGETTRQHAPEVRKIGPGAYRAECLVRTDASGAHLGCGWVGDLHEGHWWKAKADADADAARHLGVEPKPNARGTTPTRPVRISDALWNGVLAVSVAEGVSASEVLRSAIAAYGPVAEAMEVLGPVEVARA